MAATSSSFLRNLWYYGLPAAELPRGRLVARTFLGEPIVFGRGATGQAFALRDICPHRGIPLSCGRMLGDEVECCYHGWRFNDAGICTAIPSLAGHEAIEPQKIRVRDYPVVELQGGLWIYFEDPAVRLAERPPAPQIADIPVSMAATVLEQSHFPCHIDHAVMGLMDPAHGPFVHSSWWWRSRRSIHEKSKAFGPSHLGFTMLRHRPSSNSLAYRILGGTPQTEISFQLPGVRIEHIRVGHRVVANLTCVTPIDEQNTQVTSGIYLTTGWLKAFAPLIRVFARKFLGQDRDVVVRQQQGLRHEQNLLLIRDADTQARWYQQLKLEYATAQSEQRAFVNPVKDTTLRWRS